MQLLHVMFQMYVVSPVSIFKEIFGHRENYVVLQEFWVFRVLNHLFLFLRITRGHGRDHLRKYSCYL